MHELIDYINPQDTRNLARLYTTPHSYGEVVRLLYIHIKDAVVKRADTLKVNAKTIEAFKDGTQVQRVFIEPFEERVNTTFRQRLLQILETDPVIAKYVTISEYTHEEIVCDVFSSSNNP